MTSMDNEKYLTISEVSEILRYDKRTLYRWIQSGKLKASKIGAGWRIKESDLKNIVSGVR